jgi:hypothetical protein
MKLWRSVLVGVVLVLNALGSPGKKALSLLPTKRPISLWAAGLEKGSKWDACDTKPPVLAAGRRSWEILVRALKVLGFICLKCIEWCIVYFLYKLAETVYDIYVHVLANP